MKPLFLLLLLAAAAASAAEVNPGKLVASARSQIGLTVSYDPASSFHQGLMNVSGFTFLSPKTGSLH